MTKICTEPQCCEYGNPTARTCACAGEEISPAVQRALDYFHKKCAEYDAEKISTSQKSG